MAIEDYDDCDICYDDIETPPLNFVTQIGYAKILDYAIKKYILGLDWQTVYSYILRDFYITDILAVYFADEGLARAKILVEKYSEEQESNN